MKRYRIIPIMLILAVLPLSGCNKIPNPLKALKSTKTVSTKPEDTDSQKNNITVQTWSEKKCSKYSPEGELIYDMNIQEPEVIIPDNLQAQYRLNRTLRENDISSDDLNSFIGDANDGYSCYKKYEGSFFISYTESADYSVLKNDGRILSLKQDYSTYIAGAAHSSEYSSYHSYDTKTGQKITLDSLTDDSEKLKLLLRQYITDQAASQIGDETVAQNVMSTDIHNFILLSEGIQVFYNTYDLGGCTALGSQKFLVPYETLENQLNDYGKEITSYASEHNDEPLVKKTTPEYMFAQSNTAYLTEEDLLFADNSTLRLARNEIFARHGRKFESQDLQDYFNTKSWYSPSTNGNAFDDSVLNDYEKKNLDAIQTAEKQLKSKEIDNGLVNLESNRNYQLDLDGDGVPETVSWTAKSEDGIVSSNLQLFINGQAQSCIPNNLQGVFKIGALDLKKGDGEIELHLNAYSDSELLDSFSFYRYHDGKLELIRDLAGKVLNGAGYLCRQNGLQSDGDGILTVRGDTPIGDTTSQFGDFYLDLSYSYANGKMEEITQEIYPKKDYSTVITAFQHDRESPYYVVSNAMTAMTEKGGTTQAFQAKPGETVCPVAWSIEGTNTYVLVINEAGACGWVKDVPMEYGKDTNYYKEETIPVWG